MMGPGVGPFQSEIRLAEHTHTHTHTRTRTHTHTPHKKKGLIKVGQRHLACFVDVITVRLVQVCKQILFDQDR